MIRPVIREAVTEHLNAALVALSAADEQVERINQELRDLAQQERVLVAVIGALDGTVDLEPEREHLNLVRSRAARLTDDLAEAKRQQLLCFHRATSLASAMMALTGDDTIYRQLLERREE